MANSIGEMKMIESIIGAVDAALNATSFLVPMVGNEKTNFINRVGQRFNYEKLSLDYPEAFEACMNHLNKEIKRRSMKKESKKLDFGLDLIKQMFNESVLKETSFEMPVSKNIVRYDEDIVVTTIKDITKKQFKNVKIDKITGEDGGAFYTIIFVLELEDDIRNDIERKRFYIMQTLAKFKAQFCSSISEILPIINMSTGSYEYTKHSTDLRFSAKICLSHTNDRDWVSGVFRGPEDKKKEAENNYNNKQDRIIADAKTSDKKAIAETVSIQEVAPRKHAIQPIKLAKAIQLYNASNISQKMLETAIKACGRSELEFYVLRSVGIEADVDVSDVDSNSQVGSKKGDAEGKDKYDGGDDETMEEGIEPKI